MYLVKLPALTPFKSLTSTSLRQLVPNPTHTWLRLLVLSILVSRKRAYIDVQQVGETERVARHSDSLRP